MSTKIQNKTLQNQAPNVPFLDTLAQLRKTDNSTYSKRAKSKFITNAYLLSLIDLKSPLQKSYWNTFHCSNVLLYDKDEKKIIGKYCNNRWCLVCNRIRSAKLIKSYEKEIESLPDLQFVTLTIPNVHGDDIKKSIELMQINFRRILDKARKQKKKFQRC
jgi:hypothetical protein